MTLIDWQGSGGGLISYTRDCSPGIEFLNGTSAATLLTHFSDHFTRLVLILQGNSGLNLSSNRNHHLKSQQLTSCKLLSDRIKLPLFSTVFPSNICMFLSCSSFVVITTFSTGLVGVEVTSVSWLGQETKVTSTPTRPVVNVVITTKGLQDSY